MINVGLAQTRPNYMVNMMHTAQHWVHAIYGWGGAFDVTHEVTIKRWPIV